MINSGYLRWKLARQIADTDAAAAQAALDAAAAASAASAASSTASTAQSTATTAQSTANTGVSNAATAQTTAETALAAAETAAATSAAQTEPLAATAGLCNAPSFAFAGSPLSVQLYCSTSGATISFRINGGSWTTYTTTIGLSPGDTLEAYASKAGLTDSSIVTYES